MSGELVRREELGELVGKLSRHGLDRAERGVLLARLTRLLAAGARDAGARAALTGRWLGDVVTDVAPHVPVRDLATMQQHHDGLRGEALVQALVGTAALATAGVGAAGGALSAVQFAAPVTLLATPVQLVAETLAVVAIEIKLVAELHVVHGRAPLLPQGQLAAAYLASWAAREPVDPVSGPPALSAVLTAAVGQQLRRRVARRLGRNLSTLAPFLVGAVAGAELNRRETRALGEALVEQLRR
ncbi:MAG: hypothetical protein H7323_00625 [Frankiales bacterium]|nr:hypothetical protein [Frankiales bacterium]